MALTPVILLPLFRVRFPEFDGEDDAFVTTFIDEALNINCQSTNGVLYLSAHFVSSALSLNTNTTDPPTTTSNSNCAVAASTINIGGINRQFKDIVRRPQDNMYITTPYGIKYLEFRDAAQGYGAAMFTV